MEFVVVIALLVLVVSFCEAASISERFCCILSCANASIEGPLDTKTKENVVFAAALPKIRRRATQISGI